MLVMLSDSCPQTVGMSKKKKRVASMAIKETLGDEEVRRDFEKLQELANMIGVCACCIAMVWMLSMLSMYCMV